MDERDLHPSSIDILTDDSSEGIHLKLELLALWNTCASRNRFNVQVDGQRTIRITLWPVLRPSLESFGLGVAVAGVTFGDTLTSDVFSEKVTFPFRALKSDMMFFFTTMHYRLNSLLHLRVSVQIV